MKKLWTVFDWVEWTGSDKELAWSHGWDIFDVNGCLEIQALESDMTDVEAAKKVATGAEFGGALERKALLVLAKHIVTKELGVMAGSWDLAETIDTLFNHDENYVEWKCSVTSLGTIYRCIHVEDDGMTQEQHEAKKALMDALMAASVSGLFDRSATNPDIIDKFCDAIQEEFGDEKP